MSEIDLGPVKVALAAMPTGEGSRVDQSASPDFRHYTNAEDKALAGLVRPAYMPNGLEFFDAALIRSPIEMVITTYYDEKTGRSLTLAETPLEQLKETPGGKRTVFAPGQSLYEVRVGVLDGARVVISEEPDWRGARTSLVWLKGGSVFQLTGRGIGDDEVGEIAASV